MSPRTESALFLRTLPCPFWVLGETLFNVIGDMLSLIRWFGLIWYGMMFLVLGYFGYFNMIIVHGFHSPADTQLDLEVVFFSLLILVVYMLPLKNLADATLASLSILIKSRCRPKW